MISPKAAIEDLKILKKICYTTRQSEALDFAINLLGKRIAIKPFEFTHIDESRQITEIYMCPNCKTDIAKPKGYICGFCPKCGQGIDWRR